MDRRARSEDANGCQEHRRSCSGVPERVGTASNPVHPRRHQNRAQLAAPSQSGLESWASVVLAAGNVRELGDQVPALSGDECPDGGALGFQSQAAVAGTR